MRLLLELSLECESLARSEAISGAKALGTHASVEVERPGVVVIDTDADPESLARRLALCHCISEYLFSCSPAELEARASEIDVPGPIRVHSTRIGRSFPEVDLKGVNSSIGAAIGRRAGVDIHAPRSEIRVALSSDASVGRLLSRVDRPAYERRKVRYMPFNHPISIHPKFARALVNLTGIRDRGRLLDPFCGTGAVVMEAALSGCSAVGTDISERMIEGARTNLRTVGADAELMRCDVGEISNVVGKVDGMATDPPYGRSTSTGGEPLCDLLARTLAASADVLSSGSRLALVLHDTGMLESNGDFEAVESHDLWVHKSLTRHFCVLRRV
jgi:tRNA (guanine10-N2)-dimethyltransferase